MATPAVSSRHDRPNGAPVARPILPDTADNSSTSDSSGDSLHKQRHPEPTAPSPRRDMSFFDVGGLLETGVPDASPERRRSRVSTLVEGTVAQDFASTTPTQSRRGSRALLQDLGGLLTPTASRTSGGADRHTGRRQSDSHIHPPSRHTRVAPAGVLGPHLERHETHHSLQDAGGLLFGIPESNSDVGYRRTMSDSNQIPPPRRPSPRQRREQESGQQMELQDLGGILSDSREPDASASALHRTTSRSRSQRRKSHQLTPQNLPPPTLSPPSPGWEGMEFGDAGGLLGK